MNKYFFLLIYLFSNSAFANDLNVKEAALISCFSLQQHPLLVQNALEWEQEYKTNDWFDESQYTKIFKSVLEIEKSHPMHFRENTQSNCVSCSQSSHIAEPIYHCSLVSNTLSRNPPPQEYKNIKFSPLTKKEAIENLIVEKCISQSGDNFFISQSNSTSTRMSNDLSVLDEHLDFINNTLLPKVKDFASENFRNYHDLDGVLKFCFKLSQKPEIHSILKNNFED